MPVSIRLYQSADREACRELWVQLTEHHRDIYDAPHIGGSDPGSHFDELLEETDLVWVAESESGVVGVAGLIIRGSEGELEPIVIDRDHRATGVGELLASQVIVEARAHDLRTLIVKPAARNRDAINFFHHLGFDILGQLELMLDLVPGEGRWVEGEDVAGRRFSV